MPPQGGRKHPHQDFIQIDTTNILFICGGAFDGIEKIIANRVGKKTMGFGAEIRSKTEADHKELMAQLEPEDLLKYGLIPEFIGRLPVLVTLQELGTDALVRIINEPKNALLKQYKKLFSMDNVELEIEDDAVRQIANKAIERKTGARGLRSIMEGLMTDIMFEIPSRNDIRKCIITKDTVDNADMPKLILADDADEQDDSKGA